MSFMVYYCERHRRAWPVSDGGKCPEDDGCEVKARDSIALVNNYGRLLTEMEDSLREEGRAFVPGDGMVSPPP